MPLNDSFRGAFPGTMTMRKRKTHCKNGHLRVPENISPNWGCKICAHLRSTKWQQNHPEKVGEIQRKSQRKSKYGLTEEKYNRLLEKQNGVCAVCKRPPTPGQPLVIDHDHGCCPEIKTCGACVRGLIHQSCNLAIGGLEDNPILLRNAAEYLENPPARSL